MRISSFKETSKIYECSKNAFIFWRSVNFPEFQNFTWVVQKLINSVGELDEDDEWFKLIKKVRGVRFNAIASPLLERYLQEQLEELINHLQNNRVRFIKSLPNAAIHYDSLLQIGSSLKKTNKSLLLSALLEELVQHKQEGRASVVVVCQSRLVADAEKSLIASGFHDVEVTSPPFLRGDVSFDNMMVIGPTRWYPNFVFSAPRAEDILVLKYSWIRDHWKHQAVFAGSVKQNRSKLMQSEIDEPLDNMSVDADILMPPAFDFQQIQKQMADANREHNEVDYVPARLFLLEEGWVVPFSADDTSSTLVIDLKDAVSPVRKLKVNEIEPGIFVLLRTSGGGDFIVPVADQIMEESGKKAREHQRKWKSLLRSKVAENGYDTVAEALRTFGSTRANYINIRNWISDRNIKTEFRNDFDAILSLLDLKQDRDLYWNLMVQIDHAHRRAGHIIGKMLLNKVRDSDLRALKRTGKMDFELDTENQISITAFQVKDISPDKVKVMPWQLGTPIRQGE
jgi:hypothetical protein